MKDNTLLNLHLQMEIEPLRVQALRVIADHEGQIKEMAEKQFDLVKERLPDMVRGQVEAAIKERVGRVVENAVQSALRSLQVELEAAAKDAARKALGGGR
jgi:hypothetical protein